MISLHMQLRHFQHPNLCHGTISTLWSAVGPSLCCCMLATQGICFSSYVMIIPQQAHVGARVGVLLTHARAIDRPRRCRSEPHLFLSLHADRRCPPPTPPKHIACPPEDSHVQQVFMNDPENH